MIKKLKVTNFRKFKKKELEFTKPYVIFYGPNAVGKTSILEAISILTNGSSSWTHENEDLYNQEQKADKHYRVEGEFQENSHSTQKAVFQNNGERVFFINGKKTTRSKYRSSTASTIFSPETIELLMISPERRRDFLDSFISMTDPDFGEKLASFSKALRQRNAILKKLGKRFFEGGQLEENSPLLKFWDDTVASLSTSIARKREEFINQLKSEHFFIKYKPSVVYSELDLLANNEDHTLLYKKLLRENARKDILTGRTNLGAHRDDWDIIAKGNMRKFGSRGEKRVAITRLILCMQEILTEALGFAPIFLGDDIPSELDAQNTARILEEIYTTQKQVFLTTIELSQIPQEFIDCSDLVELN